MRKLQTTDVFAVMRVITASGVREELKGVIRSIATKEKMSVEDIGIEGVMAILSGLSGEAAEKALYKVFAGPIECTADEVAAMDLEKLVEALKTIWTENDMPRFFGYLSSLMNSKSLT